MIARVFEKAASHARVCRYLCRDKERAEVLETEGVRGHDYRLMARDFNAIDELRPLRSCPVFHAVLDFHPAEGVDDVRMVEIARRYMQEIKMVNTQYAFVKHIDKRHPHLHIVANRIDYDGKHIVTWPEILNSKDAEQKLIREYGLMAAGKKNLRATNLDALDNSETRVYIVYNAVKESLPGCQSLEDLGQRLLQRGIDTRYRVDEATGKRIGISFRYHQEAFKGSRIDREFSLPRLEERLAQQQTLDRWQQEKLGLLERQVQEQAAAEAQAAALAQALAEAQKEKEELLRKETLQQEAAEVHRHRIRIS